MLIKLKQTIVYKKESEDSGMIFSIGDDSKQILKLKGLVNLIVKELSEGIDINEIKNKVLNEYQVDEDRLMDDLKGLKEKLVQLDFLEK